MLQIQPLTRHHASSTILICLCLPQSAGIRPIEGEDNFILSQIISLSLIENLDKHSKTNNSI